jgi:high affinity Mn2+ porin
MSREMCSKTKSAMKTRQLRAALSLMLLGAIANLNGQGLSSQVVSLNESVPVLEAKDSDFKASNSTDEAVPEQQNWLLHVQATEMLLGQPGFRSPYAGTNSIEPDDNFRQTTTLDLFLGARLWPGGEIYGDVEYYQGFGFANTHGIAAFPNAEGSKVGQRYGDGTLPHLFFRQTWGFGGEQEDLEGDQLQLAEKLDISRLTLTLGRLETGDQFDTNAYAHDARRQFINWALVNNGAYDYAGDSYGYIEGATLELNQKQWALRYGIFDVPRVSNGFAKDGHLLKAWQQVVELEERYTLLNHPGKIRLLGWLERAHMGSYEETLADPALMEDITKTRRYRYQYGFAFNVEQTISDNVGAFLRASWRDGQSEVWQYTDIDQSVSGGFQCKGQLWNRKNDTVGIAGIIDGISDAHRDFLAAGGLGPLIGDGRLPHYSLEKVVETYYDVEVTKYLHFALDYQFVADPAYNSDRGPINIFAARFHFQL